VGPPLPAAAAATSTLAPPSTEQVTMAATMAAAMHEDEFEDDGGEEWMRLLEGYDHEREKDDKEPMEVADDGEEAVEILDPMEVSNEGDATALIAEVKDRLNRTGNSSKYHEFLTAISQSTVDHEAALAILRGHPDLILSFRRCFTAPNEEAPAVMDSLDEHRGSDARAAQLVHLVFCNALKAGHEFEQSKMLEYVKKRAAMSAFPRRLIVLRGPPGVGKSQWALKELRQESLITAGLGQGEALAVQLTHVCSTDDFFMQFSSGTSAEMQYVFNPRSLEANHAMNEARVRLAMEIGIDPVYVDNTNMRLWEMRPYVMLADRMGYVVTVVSPGEISPSWNDVDMLVSRNQEKHRRTTDKYVGRPSLEAMTQYFEPLADATDPRPAIRGAERPAEEEGRFGISASEHSTKLPPSALLYKFEKLLREGKELLRYMPPDGKGWGVNGEKDGEWHSFREKGDGSCCYDDRLHWWTEEPEGTWTLDELAMLADLRKEAQQLPQAELPTATSHPSLFGKEEKTSWKAPTAPPKAPKAKEAPAKPPSKPATEAPGAKQVSRAGHWQASPEEAAPVPASRSERFKLRMMAKRAQEAQQQEKFEDAEDAPPQKKARAKAKAVPKPVVQDLEELGDAEFAVGLPTEQEEISASTFLAAVKARLVEWGKVEQYHEFVLALSGIVDAKAAVRILRGHDDLLRVFRRKFAPQADLMAIKAELKEEDGDMPHPPSHPPTKGGMVKQELGAKGPRTVASAAPRIPPGLRVKTEAGHDGPRPPSGPPVKQELGRGVKAEVKSEDAPRPPKFSPNAPRPTVTIGEDSDEELDNEASIAAAVKKGKDECIAQLAKTIFRRERATHEGARPRLSLVRYATKVAARPRFPREVFIMRGPPGIGKTEYAMQQLADYVQIDADDALAVRLTHICAADDFFEQFKGDDAVYKFEAGKLEGAHCRNETRVRLAMEAGIHPLYVDCTNLRLWEMRPYVLLAERLGYVVTIVEPLDICEKWDDAAFLTSANDTTERRKNGKVIQRPALTAMIKAFEAGDLTDPLKAIKAAHRSEGPRSVEVVPEPPAQRPQAAQKPAWMRVKEEAQAASQKRAAPGPAKPTQPGYAPPGKGGAKGGGGKRW